VCCADSLVSNRSDPGSQEPVAAVWGSGRSDSDMMIGLQNIRQ